MSLRGTRPSPAEYAAVREDPNAYGTAIDAYLEDDRFLATVRQWFTEWLELDQGPDVYPAGFPAVGALSALGTHELNTSIIQAPGRLAEHIVRNDAAWSQIVTADYTLADHTVATVWGLPYDAAAGGWQVTDYPDGRPTAGVLSDGWVFTRMPSTENNRHRERASLIASTFICHDYPGRPVKIPPDIDLTSEEAIANAVTTVPACVGCHHTLDPLASFFAVHYALRIPEYETAYPLVQYTPDAAADFDSPIWYGEPAEDLEALGRLIAEDPRFAACQVRRFYSELMHVPVKSIPIDAVLRYLPSFLVDEMNVKTLVRAIVLSDEFAAKSASDPNWNVGLRRATPQQLDDMFIELAGYQWLVDVQYDLGSGPVGTVPMLRDFVWGYRTLAGGPNNFDTTTHRRTADPTTLLALRNLAERAARHTVEHDGTSPPLLLTVPDALTGEPVAVRRQLVELHLRLYGEIIDEDDPEVDRAWAIFADAPTPSRGWELVLNALFQDVRVLYY
ncbi:MAG: DUF1592 domain-containing protein [Myxococcales bacterium FL481]|nr:MAG: DUF1592 domain-containing protein [Myxococcales bacterium FL481]